MQKTKVKKGVIQMTKGLPVFNLNAAGIDLGDTTHSVAINDGEGGHFVKTTTAFTCDLYEIVRYLLDHGVTTAAMESTGIYWIPLYQILEKAGIEVYLVNAKHVKNVTGRKKDDSDSIWLQKLHTCGLLNKSFQPEVDMRVLREYTRNRDGYIKSAADAVRRMQKALEQMNIKLHTLISDLTGKSGMAIVKAILNGERNGATLYQLCDYRIKATKEEIIKSLEGIWSETQLTILEDNLETYEYYHMKMDKWDKKIENQLQLLAAKGNDGEIPALTVIGKKPKKTRRNEFAFDAQELLKKVVGIDITSIDSIGEMSAVNFISEVGTDMSKWKNDKHFASWLNLAPNNKITGGKQISSKTPKKKNRAGAILRQAASTLANNKGPLGDYYRRIRVKQGGKGAAVATANKLSRVLYTMLKTKTAFDNNIFTKNIKKSNEERIRKLQKQIEKLKQAA